MENPRNPSYTIQQKQQINLHVYHL